MLALNLQRITSDMTGPKPLVVSAVVASVGALLAAPGPVHADNLSSFVKTHAPGPSTGELHYLGPLRLPRRLGRLAAGLGLGRTRRVVHVDNAALSDYTAATRKGYLEVVIPAGKGHMYFRHGEDVFDFGDGGFRAGDVRPIKSDRYGILIPLNQDAEQRLGSYLARLKATGGKELGTYDFEGDKGFHCANWMSRVALDDRGRTLVDLLGGKRRDWDSMPRLSRFLLKRARGVEAVVVYHDGPRSRKQLGKKPAIVSLRQLRQLRGDGN